VFSADEAQSFANDVVIADNAACSRLLKGGVLYSCRSAERRTPAPGADDHPVGGGFDKSACQRDFRDPGRAKGLLVDTTGGRRIYRVDPPQGRPRKVVPTGSGRFDRGRRTPAPGREHAYAPTGWGAGSSCST